MDRESPRSNPKSKNSSTKTIKSNPFYRSSSNQVIESNIISSMYHLDITPSESGQQDKLIIQSLLKEIASTHQLDPKAQRPFKVVVINEVDQLSKEAQAALRRTMEKYVAKCRLILVCENMGKVLAPLRSRCLMIRVPSPSTDEIERLLTNIA
jgi:replication factor C subunit 3/5